MATVRPFPALRPQPERAAAVAAVPYDVVNTEEARALAWDNPYSFLRVSRPEIEMPEGTDIYSDAVYEHAKRSFARLVEQAPLITEDTPSFYVYRLRMGERTQTGLVTCCSVDEYDNDIIRKHERTRKDKEDDRTRHILTLRAQTGPVLATYRPHDMVNDLTKAVTSPVPGTFLMTGDGVEHSVTPTAPLFDFVAPDGIAHTIWRVPGELNPLFVAAFLEVPLIYIADGHHRAKSASRAREVLRAANSQHSGSEEYNFFQCVLFPADQLQILPYNRVVKDLNGYTVEDFLQEVGRTFEITPDAAPQPERQGRFAMYLAGRWYGLKLRRDVTRSYEVLERLDVSILQHHLIAPVLAIQDLRNDNRIDFIGGIRGTAELERLVKEGKAAIAFSLFATTLDDLMKVSDAGEIMPPKSTWFEPKLRDGLLSHLI